MRDYSQWLQRAEKFVRSISALRGEWSVKVSIAPPLCVDECDQVARKLPHGLPDFLRDFYVTASGDAEVSFSWKPSQPDLGIIGKVIPEQYTLYGGPEFCAASELLEHHDHLMGFAEVFDDLGGFGLGAAEVVRQSVPIISIGNGDYIAWHAVEGRASLGMYYVSHETDVQEESPIFRICDSLESFVNVWEKLGYVGPEFWILNHFRDSPERTLDANSKNAMRWRLILKSFDLPVVE